jgi:hypothetical protein
METVFIITVIIAVIFTWIALGFLGVFCVIRRYPKRAYTKWGNDDDMRVMHIIFWPAAFIYFVFLWLERYQKEFSDKKEKKNPNPSDWR